MHPYKTISRKILNNVLLGGNILMAAVTISCLSAHERFFIQLKETGKIFVKNVQSSVAICQLSRVFFC